MASAIHRWYPSFVIVCVLPVFLCREHDHAGNHSNKKKTSSNDFLARLRNQFDVHLTLDTKLGHRRNQHVNVGLCDRMNLSGGSRKSRSRQETVGSEAVSSLDNDR